ncbi:hypothetical protein BJX63DRAFT_441305 [Aspergillus granulosus]|uniref:HMG box domain-containing protein n=1 Tax=Aspergillus granulosus TaxID=176169 RepID=A0ABR4HN98_9EURO
MGTVSIAKKSTTQSPDYLTERLWQDALRNLGSTDNEVLLPTNVVDMIGQDNVEKIESRLCALLGAPVVTFIDESINALRVLRVPAFSGTSISVASHEGIAGSKSGEGLAKARAASAKPPKIPRPPNAFILYRQHHHPKVKEAYPDLSNNEISVILGKQWRDEPEQVRLNFKSMAEEYKKKHAKEYPNYQYTPRKPSERKRRATSRQYPKSKRSSIPLESPPSITAPSPNAFTPSMYPDTQNAHGMMEGYSGPLGNFDVMFDSANLADEHMDFSSNAFDALFQQTSADYDGTAMFSPLGIAERSIPNPFEFHDSVANWF